MTRIRPFLLALLLLSCLSGCASFPVFWASETGDLRMVGREMAAALMSASRESFDLKATVVTSTFVNIDDLKSSSTLGRALSSHVVSALNEMGYRVVALNLTQSLQMREKTGELVLSRNVNDLLDHRVTADALIVGTYYLTRNHVYVTGRLIQPTTGEILASHEVRLPLNDDIKKLISPARPDSLFQ